ncbi:MAG: hypothetical protein FJZ59_06565 [Chlamydiae bacterium]|nr:hypothetical protein [Chlamydiota bacterium]
MEYTRLESAKEICYEISFPSDVGEKRLDRLAKKAQSLFKELKTKGEISLLEIPLVISEESYSGKDLAFCYQITSETIIAASQRGLFSSGVRSYASINLDSERFSVVISKS